MGDLVDMNQFRGGMDAAFAGLDPHAESLSDGIGSSYGVINYKGKVWSLRYRGERKVFIRPDDGSPLSYLDVVILAQGRTKSKSFFNKYDPATSDGERPVCSSIDGVTPDADILQPQAANCALCPRNVWKVDPNTGRKGRECTDYKRLAILLLPTITAPIYGEPLMEPVFLRVPPASLNNLSLMGDSMAQQGFHYSSFITRISFDPAKAHPEMIFRPFQKLTVQEAPVVLELRSNALCGRITMGDVALPAARIHAEAIAPIARGLAPAGTTPTGLGQAIPFAPTGISEDAGTQTRPTSSMAAAFAPPATLTGGPAAPPASGLPSTSFSESGGAPNVSTPQQTPQSQTIAAPAPQTVADTGEPQESDADIDARVAALLGNLKS